MRTSDSPPGTEKGLEARGTVASQALGGENSYLRPDSWPHHPARSGKSRFLTSTVGHRPVGRQLPAGLHRFLPIWRYPDRGAAGGSDSLYAVPSGFEGTTIT